MNKELIAGLAWGGTFSPWRSAQPSHKLGYIDGDTVTRVVVGMNGLMIAYNGNLLPKAVVPSACDQRAKRMAGLGHGGERARLCPTVCVRPDPGGRDGREWRGLDGSSSNARLQPVAARQGESRLIQACFEARQPRGLKVANRQRSTQ